LRYITILQGFAEGRMDAHGCTWTHMLHYYVAQAHAFHIHVI